MRRAYLRGESFDLNLEFTKNSNQRFGIFSFQAGLGTVAVAVPLGGHPGGTARFLKKMKIVAL